MSDRLYLQAKFEGILGSRNVYFQPPESVKINYPAIVYSLSTIVPRHADNLSYIQSYCYEAVLIDKNPDSKFIQPILQLPYCSLGRPYTKDNLNHYPFTIYQH